jgi:putative tryptophan/tyrosine transport system substrate-binding protein
MNTRRKIIFALGAGVLAPLAAFAQPQTKVWRIGYLDLGSRQSLVDTGRYAALIQGLRDLGYVEGKNFVLEARYADGKADVLDGIAAELVRQNVDLIVSTGTPACKAAQRATTTIPIVVTVTGDPVIDGLAASLARPGGNITGMSSGIDDTVKKLVELLSIAVPKMKRVAAITNSANVTHTSMLSSIQAAARQTGMQVMSVSVHTPDEIERGFEAMVRQRIDAVVIVPDVLFLQQLTQIAGLASKHRLPSIYGEVNYAEAGGLIGYGADRKDNFRRAAIFVDKILKGAKPAELPFEQPTRYYMAINRKAAAALGLTIPQRLLISADKVIE